MKLKTRRHLSTRHPLYMRCELCQQYVEIGTESKPRASRYCSRQCQNRAYFSRVKKVKILTPTLSSNDEPTTATVACADCDERYASLDDFQTHWLAQHFKEVQTA